MNHYARVCRGHHDWQSAAALVSAKRHRGCFSDHSCRARAQEGVALVDVARDLRVTGAGEQHSAVGGVGGMRREKDLETLVAPVHVRNLVKSSYGGVGLSSIFFYPFLLTNCPEQSIALSCRRACT